jgi:ribonucleotide monophosphatase NagD (HAD superfamily)
MGCDLRVFLDHSGFCPEMHAKVEGIITAGETVEPKHAYKQHDIKNQKTKANGPVDVHGHSFLLAGGINDEEMQITNSGVYLDKLMASLIYKCGEKSELECQAGFAKSIQQDNCGRYQAGWYKCQSEYFGNAFEGFVNPFIWNKQTKGLQLTFRQGPLECWGHYGVALDNAANTTNAQGFANSDTPGECDAGICYKIEGPCPARVSLMCQQINAGSKGFATNKDYLYNNGKGNTEGNGSLTTAASAALAQSQEESQYANALTAGCDSEFQGVDVNGYLTCANVKNTSDNSARILKWSVGCVSKCRPIKCLPIGGLGAQAFGINLGTPAYLSQDLKTKKANALSGASAPASDVTLKADDVPLM